MNTDKQPEGQPESLYKAETHAILGFCFAVLNEAGHGLHEKIIIDAKVIDRITDHERGKMINYLHWDQFARWLDCEFQTRPPRIRTNSGLTGWSPNLSV